MYDQATLEKELKEIFERAKGCNTNNKSAPALLRRWVPLRTAWEPTRSSRGVIVCEA